MCSIVFLLTGDAKLSGPYIHCSGKTNEFVEMSHLPIMSSQGGEIQLCMNLGAPVMELTEELVNEDSDNELALQ